MIKKKFIIDEIFLLNKNAEHLKKEKLLEEYYCIVEKEMSMKKSDINYIFVGIFNNEESLNLFKLKYNLIESK